MTIKVLIGVKFDENLLKSVLKNRTFRKFEWWTWKILDCRVLLQIPRAFCGPWVAPRPPAARCATRDGSRRTPLWKFLPTGLSELNLSMSGIFFLKPLPGTSISNGRTRPPSLLSFFVKSSYLEHFCYLVTRFTLSYVQEKNGSHLWNSVQSGWFDVILIKN